MNLFLDAANTDCWADLAGTRLFSGITTNPLLIQRAGLKTSIRTYQTLYDRAMKLGYPCIQFQVFGGDWVQCAQSISSIGPEVFIKIPANKMGFEVISKLSLADRTTLTAVYSVGQVIAAEALQVAYTEPYYAKLRDAIENADELFDRMQDVAFETELLVASMQSNAQFLDLAARGFSSFALPEPIARAFFESTLADKSITDFEDATRS
ncbi:MAG: transaldolase family protein [Pseudomonadota bacterium]|nr:transaldolase family protein [Pseudomonadota bacterium]